MANLENQLLQTGFWVFIGYLVLFVLFLLLSDFSIFLPPKPTSFRISATSHHLHVGEKSIKATYLANSESKHVILYSHGNAEDLGLLEPLFYEYHRRGYAVFAYDYQGYGLSDGKPSESNTYQDINAAYRYLIDELGIRPENIIVYGRSLGGGPSVELASKQPVGALVLEATFTSAFRVITHWPIFPYDKFRNLAKISKVTAPVMVIHGDEDSIISDYHGKKLFKKANEPKTFYSVKGADHNDLLSIAGEAYWQNLAAFVASLSQPKQD